MSSTIHLFKAVKCIYPLKKNGYKGMCFTCCSDTLDVLDTVNNKCTVYLKHKPTKSYTISQTQLFFCPDVPQSAPRNTTIGVDI
jgi:hypothetical protein